MRPLNFNGEIIPADWPVLHHDNRAFSYGDALFETIRVFNGKMPFLTRHYERLALGAERLGYWLPEGFSLVSFEDEIRKLDVGGNYRIRFTLFRNAGGKYSPKDNGTQFLIEKTALEHDGFVWNEEGLSIGISETPLLSPTPLSDLKTGNSLPYIYAALEKEKGRWDDILLKNHEGHLAEAISSNIFILVNREIITPSLSSGCVNGTIRSWLLEHSDLKIVERAFTPEKLKRAHGIFLTNAISGIRWAKRVGTRHFKEPEEAQRLLAQLNGWVRNRGR